MFLFLVSFFSVLSKLASSDISEIKYVWRHLLRFTRKTFFLAIKPFSLECTAQSAITTKADKIHPKISFLKTAEHRKSGQYMARCRSQAGSLPVASPKSWGCASRNSPTGHERQAFVLTCNPHVILLLVPSGNQILPKLTVTHIPKSCTHRSVL